MVRRKGGEGDGIRKRREGPVDTMGLCLQVKLFQLVNVFRANPLRKTRKSQLSLRKSLMHANKDVLS